MRSAALVPAIGGDVGDETPSLLQSALSLVALLASGLGILQARAQRSLKQAESASALQAKMLERLDDLERRDEARTTELAAMQAELSRAREDLHRASAENARLRWTLDDIQYNWQVQFHELEKAKGEISRLSADGAILLKQNRALNAEMLDLRRDKEASHSGRAR